MSSRRQDVIVVGGGPAGAATSLALTRAGYSASVVERSCYETSRIGETLPPAVRVPLAELGIWDQFVAGGHAASPGVAVAWGRPELYENDFIVSPYGPGWHVDRRRFDAMLACAAQTAGAEMLIGARIVHCARDDRAGWRRQCPGQRRAAGAEKQVRGRRHRPVALVAPVRQPARRRDRLIALAGLFSSQAAEGVHARDRRTLVEAIECGWWYTALLPGGSRIATFLTDADLLPSGTRGQWGHWGEQLRRAPHTCERLGAALPPPGLRIVAAGHGRVDASGIPGLLAVGDAAASFDPLCGQGVIWALESGLAAARALNSHFRGDRSAIPEYDRWVGAEYAAYLRTHAEYYRLEDRWPDSPFWRRRV